MLRRWLGRLSPDIALDLGTANTLISVPGEGLVLDEPSIVAVDEPSRRVLSQGCAVGRLAKQMQGRTPESISVVRPLADGVITDFELCEAMLRYFFAKAQRHGWTLRPRVLVTVPGSITPVEKRALYASTHRAGARQVLLIREGTAAAIGAGLPVREPTPSMVCDIGAGATEVTVMSLGAVAAGQSIRVGGDAMDRAIAGYLRRHHNLSVGLPTAERLRIEIGSAAPLDEELVEEVRGIDTVTRLPRKLAVGSPEIRAALAETLETIVEAITRAIDACQPELAADLVDQGMVLSGGGSLLRGLDRYLHEQTGLPARVSPHALQAVARGALICLEDLPQWSDALEASDDDL